MTASASMTASANASTTASTSMTAPLTGEYVVDALAALARVPSAVPLGARTLIAPDHPTLVHYVQDHLRPRFLETGATDIIDLPANQFAVRFGDGHGPVLALMAYTPTQHHNLMPDPWSGRIRTPIERGVDEPCLFGQGVSQNKAHQACLLDLARWIVAERVPLHGTLLLCVNNEGRSSHDCSRAILDALPYRPDLVVQLFCTAFEVSVGNRGRVDVIVDVTGQATHSSNPPDEGRVIDVVADVVVRLRELDATVRDRAEHPELGREQVVPYLVSYEPLAPHTLPASARITVDRRLLPGTDPAEAAREIAAALEGIEGCEVRPGVTMLPAYLPPERREVLGALDAAVTARLGEARHGVYGGSFDAGGPSERGIPTVMFGVPAEGDLLGDDFVRLSAVRDEAAVLRDTVSRFLRK
ncbi:peptidase dimerization domain-containing protein [Nonomuraea insulae]|uniref:Peptidase dimerization domain-containing protein n=1 Tax=Nonomuraea insulae TaxID=1616787 RepID=A0ABW1CJ91_9ACTN